MFESSVIRTYLFIAAGILVFAGTAIVLLKFVLKKNADHAWRSFRGWLVMIPLVVGAILLGREVTIVFLGLVALYGFTEFARATGLYRDWLITGLVYLGIIALSFQNMVLLYWVFSFLKGAAPGSLFGQMALSQQFWNNAIAAGFAAIVALVVWGADYLKAKYGGVELEAGDGKLKVDATPPPTDPPPTAPEPVDGEVPQ